MAFLGEKSGITVLVFMAAMTSLHVCMGDVHKVGDSSGWTTVGGVDYRKWSASKTFKVGDTIVFEYNPQYHNVVEVGYQDYKACKVPTNPIAVFTKGNDSFAIKTYGHYFFICGRPGHCQAGQKVDIRVVRPSPPAAFSTPWAPSPAASLSPFASPSPSPSSPMEALAPSSDKDSASVVLHNSLGMYLLIFVGLGYLGL